MIDPGMRDDGPDINDRLLRQFSGLWLIVFTALAALQGVGRDRVVFGAILGLIAVLPGVAGLVRPRIVEPLFRMAMALAMPIGWVVSNVLLGAIFYLVITPLALFFKAIGRDAMDRRSPREASQWVPREATTDPHRYWHQS